MHIFCYYLHRLLLLLEYDLHFELVVGSYIFFFKFMFSRDIHSELE
jgi:hypothetical protein